MDRTDQKVDAPLTRPGSGPVRYELVERSGDVIMKQFKTAQEAAEFARECWPDQEQDEYRTGKGWDVQVVGCE